MAKHENADSLDLDHMRAFIAVIETGSQVQAAKRLGATTPTTVGRYIARVQEHFGGRLFVAGASGPLSSRGVLVEQAFRAALAELGRTRERLSQERPVLRIGFIRAVRPLVERALREQRSAAFEVRLSELTSEAQARALQRGELDIAISYALPELATRPGIEESAISEQPYALVIPERAWVKGRASRRALASLAHVCSPRRFAQDAVQAGEVWLRTQGIAPRHTLEVELGADILAYAGAGHGFGFLPALWSMASHDGVVFAPLEDFGATAKIAAYSLQHVTPLIARLRHDLSATARAALRQLNSPG